MKYPEREDSLLYSRKRAEALLQLWGARPNAVYAAPLPAHHCETLTDLRQIADPFARKERAHRCRLKRRKASDGPSIYDAAEAHRAAGDDR